jgi:hypothetical protein
LFKKLLTNQIYMETNQDQAPVLTPDVQVRLDLEKQGLAEKAILELEERFGSLEITDLSDETQLEAVKKAHREVLKARTGIEKYCKQAREMAIATQKAIIGVEKALVARISPLEDKLYEESQKVAREKERLAKQEYADKVARLKASGFENIGTETAEVYACLRIKISGTELMAISMDTLEVIIAEAKDLQRLEQARKDQEEYLRKEEEARQEAIRVAQEAERLQLEQLRKEQEERAAALKAEQEKMQAEMDRMKAEQEERERRIQDQKWEFRRNKLAMVGVDYRLLREEEAFHLQVMPDHQFDQYYKEAEEKHTAQLKRAAILDVRKKELAKIGVFESPVEDAFYMEYGGEEVINVSVSKIADADEADFKVMLFDFSNQIKTAKEQQAFLVAERARIEAEEKLKAEQEEKERQRLIAEEEAARIAALAPDKEKILMYFQIIKDLRLPQVNTPEALRILSDTNEFIHGAIEGAIERLKNL